MQPCHNRRLDAGRDHAAMLLAALQPFSFMNNNKRFSVTGLNALGRRSGRVLFYGAVLITVVYLAVLAVLGSIAAPSAVEQGVQLAMADWKGWSEGQQEEKLLENTRSPFIILSTNTPPLSKQDVPVSLCRKSSVSGAGWADFKEEGGNETSRRITIYILDNGAHIDFALPFCRQVEVPWSAPSRLLSLEGGPGSVVPGTNTVNPIPVMRTVFTLDWARVFPSLQRATGQKHPEQGERGDWLLIGWGQREFYITTPEWGDIKAGTVLRAVIGAPAALHVDLHTGEIAQNSRVKRVFLTDEEYISFVHFIASSAKLGKDGKTVKIDAAGYGISDSFYEGTGTFSVLATCNTWAAKALQRAGQPAPLWTPLSWIVMQHLP